MRLRTLLLAAAALYAAAPVMAGNTAKTRNLEDRLNTAIPRVPWPQPYDGPASNSSYPYGQYSYQSGNDSWNTGNTSYQVNTGWNCAGSADNNNVTSGQIGGASAHYHAMAHGHFYGNAAQDINAIQSTLSTLVNCVNSLRNSYSGTVTAFNNHVGDYQNMTNAFNTLRNDHSNLLNEHNGLMYRLNASGLLR